ncbi:hypothetical protein Q8F55_008409 [Vanrija albida]|uniref:Gfo/Idh/MocA-like oxidoreductase N-terminal domain-containing protein n=1 Tax=Vanrija albida TaxID=181172 RepID=A0ABR3PW55_9TREE
MPAPTPSSKPVSIIILGGGQRGVVYADYAVAHPDLVQVVAVADPRPLRRKLFARRHRLDNEHLFNDWEDVAKLPRFADAVAICTLDKLHAPMVSAFSKLGYHILCEKPMATSIPDCINMVREIETGRTEAGSPLVFGVGHVLRYSPYNQAIKDVIDSGVLGDIVNIQHIEPVGNEHFVHSFVRGNWRSETETTFALMAKCCHDLDIVSFYLSGRKPVQVSSFGSLSLFKPSRKPKEAGDAKRCLECPAEEDCVWSAKKVYLEKHQGSGKQHTNWAVHVVNAEEINEETVTEALKTGPYGVCAFEAGNDVVDHQVVNVEYEDGVTAAITMSAFTEAECNRGTVIHGTRGELIGDMETFTVFDFLSRTKKHHVPKAGVGLHGGGDFGLAEAFVSAVHNDDQSKLGVTPDDVLNSHLVVFAAETARREKRVVDFASFKEAAMKA